MIPQQLWTLNPSASSISQQGNPQISQKVYNSQNESLTATNDHQNQEDISTKTPHFSFSLANK